MARRPHGWVFRSIRIPHSKHTTFHRAPAADAQPSGAWTIITRPDGGRQWAYKGQPVYVFYRDKADGIATGAQLIPGWRLAK